MEHGQKQEVALYSLLSSETNDMFQSVSDPTLIFNRQKWQGGYLPTSVRFEMNGWAAGHYGYDYELVASDPVVDTEELISGTISKKHTYLSPLYTLTDSDNSVSLEYYPVTKVTKYIEHKPTITRISPTSIMVSGTTTDSDTDYIFYLTQSSDGSVVFDYTRDWTGVDQNSGESVSYDSTRKLYTYTVYDSDYNFTDNITLYLGSSLTIGEETFSYSFKDGVHYWGEYFSIEVSQDTSTGVYEAITASSSSSLDEYDSDNNQVTATLSVSGASLTVTYWLELTTTDTISWTTEEQLTTIAYTTVVQKKSNFEDNGNSSNNAWTFEDITDAAQEAYEEEGGTTNLTDYYRIYKVAFPSWAQFALECSSSISTYGYPQVDSLASIYGVDFDNIIAVQTGLEYSTNATIDFTFTVPVKVVLSSSLSTNFTGIRGYASYTASSDLDRFNQTQNVYVGSYTDTATQTATGSSVAVQTAPDGTSGSGASARMIAGFTTAEQATITDWITNTLLNTANNGTTLSTTDTDGSTYYCTLSSFGFNGVEDISCALIRTSTITLPDRQNWIINNNDGSTSFDSNYFNAATVSITMPTAPATYTAYTAHARETLGYLADYYWGGSTTTLIFDTADIAEEDVISVTSATVDYDSTDSYMTAAIELVEDTSGTELCATSQFTLNYKYLGWYRNFIPSICAGCFLDDYYYWCLITYYSSTTLKVTIFRKAKVTVVQEADSVETVSTQTLTVAISASLTGCAPMVFAQATGDAVNFFIYIHTYYYSTSCTYQITYSPSSSETTITNTQSVSYTATTSSIGGTYTWECSGTDEIFDSNHSIIGSVSYSGSAVYSAGTTSSSISSSSMTISFTNYAYETITINLTASSTTSLACGQNFYPTFWYYDSNTDTLYVLKYTYQYSMLYYISDVSSLDGNTYTSSTLSVYAYLLSSIGSSLATTISAVSFNGSFVAVASSTTLTVYQGTSDSVSTTYDGYITSLAVSAEGKAYLSFLDSTNSASTAQLAVFDYATSSSTTLSYQENTIYSYEDTYLIDGITQITDSEIPYYLYGVSSSEVNYIGKCSYDYYAYVTDSSSNEHTFDYQLSEHNLADAETYYTYLGSDWATDVVDYQTANTYLVYSTDGATITGYIFNTDSIDTKAYYTKNSNPVAWTYNFTVTLSLPVITSYTYSLYDTANSVELLTFTVEQEYSTANDSFSWTSYSVTANTIDYFLAAMFTGDYADLDVDFKSLITGNKQATSAKGWAYAGLCLYINDLCGISFNYDEDATDAFNYLDKKSSGMFSCYNSSTTVTYPAALMSAYKNSEDGQTYLWTDTDLIDGAIELNASLGDFYRTDVQSWEEVIQVLKISSTAGYFYEMSSDEVVPYFIENATEDYSISTTNAKLITLGDDIGTSLLTYWNISAVDWITGATVSTEHDYYHGLDCITDSDALTIDLTNIGSFDRATYNGNDYSLDVYNTFKSGRTYYRRYGATTSTYTLSTAWSEGTVYYKKSGSDYIWLGTILESSWESGTMYTSSDTTNDTYSVISVTSSTYESLQPLYIKHQYECLVSHVDSDFDYTCLIIIAAKDGTDTGTIPAGVSGSFDALDIYKENVYQTASLTAENTYAHSYSDMSSANSPYVTISRNGYYYANLSTTYALTVDSNDNPTTLLRYSTVTKVANNRYTIGYNWESSTSEFKETLKYNTSTYALVSSVYDVEVTSSTDTSAIFSITGTDYDSATFALENVTNESGISIVGYNDDTIDFTEDDISSDTVIYDVTTLGTTEMDFLYLGDTITTTLYGTSLTFTKGHRYHWTAQE